MTDLLTRLESAAEGQERELLFEAFNVCCPQPFAGQSGYREWAEVRHQFKIFANFGAWTSAAEMLLQDGQDEYAVTTMYGIVRVTLLTNPVGTVYTEHLGGAKFVWAALASACVKARG